MTPAQVAQMLACRVRRCRARAGDLRVARSALNGA
jgi:hypothetical protein